MAKRRRPETITARVTVAEKAVVVGVAASAGLPVAEWLHRLIVPAARAALLAETEAGTGAER